MAEEDEDEGGALEPVSGEREELSDGVSIVSSGEVPVAPPISLSGILVPSGIISDISGSVGVPAVSA